MKNLADIIYKKKNIHIIGVSGSEGSNILRFLIKRGIDEITVHDYFPEEKLIWSFRTWHKNISSIDKELLLRVFLSDLKKVKCCFGKKKYLDGIETADLIFVPQSWRLYKKQNEKLLKLNKKVSFYNLLNIYLDFTKATLIGITGSVGKGSVSYLLYQILKRNNKTVFFAGNETWRPQLADKLDEMNAQDFLILEISHRQLLEGIESAPHFVAYTHIYPNHQDEMDFQKYVDTKISLLGRQKQNDVTLLNYDDAAQRKVAKKIRSKMFFYSSKYKEKNIKSIQKIFKKITSINNTHYVENILCASSLASIIGINNKNINKALIKIKGLPARIEKIGKVANVEIIDDIKSTTPWSTIKALDYFSQNAVLICGGETKGIDYTPFYAYLAKNQIQVIVLTSRLSEILRDRLPHNQLFLMNDLTESIKKALCIAKNRQKVLISPAGAYFYSKFIKGKKSIKKIITSLPQEGQE